MADRPLGVTIICILGFLGALIYIAGGAAIFGLGGLGMMAIPAIGGLVTVMGAVVLVIGIVLLLAFFWTWKMRKRGWTIVMILEIIGIILSLLAMDFISIVLPIIIVIYLFLKRGLFT